MAIKQLKKWHKQMKKNTYSKKKKEEENEKEKDRKEKN